MNKTVKRGLSLILATLLIASSFAGCGKISYVMGGAIQAIYEIKDGSWKEKNVVEDKGDISVLEKSFEEGTYGGVEFKTIDDVTNYYVEAYNYTKSLTATYKENGNTVTYYKLLGSEELNVGEVMIDGSANAVINKLVPGIVGGLFDANTYGLVPCNNRNPELDNNFEDAPENKKADHDFRTSGLLPEDILDANVTDNGDGTITLVLQPKGAEMSTRGDDSQGRAFEVLGDIGATVSSISVISFAQGTPEENIKVTYRGGTITCKIDTKTKEILEADYDMEVLVAVNHATVTVIRDKSASLTIKYTNHYPASDEYLKKSRNIERV